MGVLKGFEQLAHELPEDERNELLNELKDELRAYSNEGETDNSENILTTDLSAKDGEEESIKDRKYLEKVYRKLPLFEKIMVIFRKMFTGKSIEQLIEDYMLKKIGKAVEASFPGLIDAKNSMLKERFYNEISIFAGSIDVFTDPVNYVNKVKPALFYRYAASREMSGFEEHLKQNTNPETIYKTGSNKNIEDLKIEINMKYNEIIDSLDADEKRSMYELARLHFYLTQLTAFPFESLKKMFVISASGYRACQFATARKLLGQLDTLISSITSEILDFELFFKYFFEFYLSGNDRGTDQSGAEEYLAKIRKKAMEAVSQIYSLKKTIPFNKILKLIYKNTDYAPGRISGGEEWFAIYKNLLKDEIDEITENFIFRQKKKNVLEKLKVFIPEMPVSEKYNFIFSLGSKSWPLKKPNLLYYLYIFYQKYYVKKIENTAATIMLDGNFYKDSNRKELNEAFNHINSFNEKYREFVSKIGINKQTGSEKPVPPSDPLVPDGKKKKKENMVRVLSKEGYKLYLSYYDAFISIKNILGGIAAGNASGKYDTLSNLSIVCEEKTSMSVNVIDKLYRQMSEILNIFKEYDELEIDEYE